MPATDYDTLVYGRIKAILLAHAPLNTVGDPAYIKGGDRVWWDVPRDDKTRPKPGMPTDWPRLELMLAGGTDEDPNQRYATMDVNYDPTAAGAGVNKRLQRTFVLTLTHRTLMIALNDPIEAEIRAAFERAGPRLGIPGSPRTPGLPNAVRGPVTFTRAPALDEETGGERRMRTQFTIPVSLVVNSADLI